MNKFNVKIKTTIAVILSLLCLNLSSARADDSDIFGANIEPNVLLLIDSSGSMKSEIPSTIYLPSTTYTSGTKISTKVYKINNQNSFNVYKQTVSEVPSSSAVTALSTVGFWVGKIGGSTVSLYLGNYLNYRDCTTCTVDERKIDIAMRVYANIVRYVEGVRFGVMRLRENGASMVSPIGTDRETMATAIENMANFGGVGTALGDELFDGGRYYKGTFDYNGTWASPIQYACQPNFVILMSDGKENSTNVQVEDEATLRYTEDHSSLTGDQNVIVHTIGFDITGDAVANDTLITAAANGGGSFFVSDNAADLERNLQEAIQIIVNGVFTFATPVVPTTSTTGSTRAYVAAVQSDSDSVFWKGYLKAYDRQADGSILLNADGTPDPSELAWEAGDRLSNPASPVYKTAAQRNIYFQSVPAAIDPQPRKRETFTTSKVGRGLVGAADNAERDQIVNFIRGVDVLDEDGDANITEDRAWKLGDIFHSTPVLVTQPRMPIVDASYDAFKADSAVTSRPSVLIVGANDGMLHAFRESDGEELWAWVPEHVFLNLKSLLAPSGAHPYFVDGSPIAADIKDGDTWKTIVLFGMRRGGRHYYALDITDTASPTLLWNFTDSKMGETWSEPSIGKIKWTDGTDKYVAFVGGGYDTDENNQSGKVFFVIDLATGAKLAEYYNDGSTDDRQYMNFSIPANPTAIDEDGDGYVDRVYVGDVGGQLWRFEPEVTPATSTPTTYTYSGFDENGDWFDAKTFTTELKGGVTGIRVYLASTVDNPLVSPPAGCDPDCYVYAWDDKDPKDEKHDYHLGYIALNSSLYGGKDKLDFTSLTLVSENLGSATGGSFTLKGKRLFEADPLQANPPAVGEYFPAQAIYGAPSVAKDDVGNLWVSFGTGDRNHPLNISTNRFYGIKDDTNMTNGNTLTESDLLKVDSSVTTVPATVQGWYFTLGANEKVLAAADTFNSTVFFTTFTPESITVCGGGGGEARLYAVKMESGFAALDFTSADNEALTGNYVGTSRWTKIGDGIPSKPAVMIGPDGNPSVITGTTSQQISNEGVPDPALPQLLGWREVF